MSGLTITGVAFALSKYTGKYSQCIKDSGGRGDIEAVKQACNYASNGRTKNGCALWIGSASSHGVPVIYAKSVTETVPAAYWGMCTDYRDETRYITAKNDNNSINDAMTLRRGLWAAPTATPTSINVAAFISGSGVTVTKSTCYIQYTRTVTIGRANGETGIYNEMKEKISVRIPTGNNKCTTENNLCKLWNSGYSSSSSTTNTSGSTSIIVKARNTEDRFGGVGSGAWSHGNEIVYAMPTDNIQWHSCYYPGVQKTVDTLVSDINGAFTNGGTGGNQYMTLPDSYCMTFQPVVGYTKLRPGYDAQIGIWQNQYKVGSGITSVGPLSFPIGNSQVRESSGNRNMGTSVGGDVGEMLEQKGETGQPISASVGSNTPSLGVYKCPCCPNPPEQKCDTVNGVQVCVTVPCTETNTCYCCTNSYSNSIRSASVSKGPTSDSAYVVVPYNFENDIEVEVPEQDVYSGEADVEVKRVTAYVNTRYNYTTIANYATIVPESKVKLFMYVSDESDGGNGGMVQKEGNCDAIDAKQCIEVDKEDESFGALNEDGELSGGKKDWFKDSRFYNAFDAAAGDYLCFIAALWPYSSGYDTNRDPSGDNMWKYSEPSCNIISKKPSFQVWGGSLYSVGSISTNISEKLNIYKDYIGGLGSQTKNCRPFCITGGSVIKFGPWVEESLVMKTGTTSTVASGAGSGLSGTAAGVGSTNELCNGRANLSFANYSTTLGGPCNNNNMVGQSGIDSGIKDREELIDYWVGAAGGPTNTSGGSYNLGNLVGDEITTATGVKVRYLNSSGELTLSGTVRQGTTYLIKSAGTVTISNNLKYNTGTYNTFGSVPKVVIYAKNVNIKCGVKEVDAIIVTANGGTVNTCSEFPDNTSEFNNPTRSKQLRIFGMVITDKIILGRTYGAAANEDGKKTDSYGIPSDGAAAEIFDYDSSTLIWSEYMAGSAETDTLQTVYQHELAPRY